MPLAYLYSRVSTKRQIDGLGLKRQAEDRDKWLAEHADLNLTVVQDYADLGVSGRGKNRTEGKLGLILAGIETGKIPIGSYIIVDSLDRITREELIDAYYLVLTIIRAGIVIVTTSDGLTYDRADRERMMFGLLISLVICARSSNESDAKSDRGLKNWRLKRIAAETGRLERPYTRMTPAWISYDSDAGRFVLNEHASAVYRIFELAAQGFGASLIVQHLIREGYAPLAAGRRKDAASWSRRYITLILGNPAILGELALGTKNGATNDKRSLTGQIAENYFPRIQNILPLWEKVRAIEAGRTAIRDKSRNRRGDFSNLFAGLCRCGTCNAAMVINHRQAPSRVSYLRCPDRYISKTCMGGSSYQYQRLEKTVLDQLDALLFPPTNAITQDDRSAAQIAEAKTRIDHLKRRIANLLDQAEEDGYAEVRERIALRRTELQAAETTLHELESKQAIEKHTLTAPEYISKIKDKRLQADSENEDIRVQARSEIKLALARIIKRMTFNADRSVSVLFDVSGHAATLEISHAGDLSIRWQAGAATSIRWHGPKGGLETARRLGDVYASLLPSDRGQQVI